MKTCPKCGGDMKRHIGFKSRRVTEARLFSGIDTPISVLIFRCEKCGFSEEVKIEVDHDHAIDACEYTMQNLFDYSKMLAEMPPMVGVEVTLRDFSNRLDEKVQKAYIDGCVLAEIDPDALNKTAELNSELQSALKEVLDKLPRWIPIEERLPDKELEEHKKRYPRAESVEVIVVIKDADEATSLYYDGEYFEDICGNDHAVTHWMPMPDPPEVQNE